MQRTHAEVHELHAIIPGALCCRVLMAAFAMATTVVRVCYTYEKKESMMLIEKRERKRERRRLVQRCSGGPQRKMVSSEERDYDGGCLG